MRKQVLAVTIAVLLVLSVFSVLQFWQIKPVSASVIMQSGWENSSGSDVTDNGVWSAQGATGNLHVSSTTKLDGSYALNVSSSSATYTSYLNHSGLGLSSLYYGFSFQASVLPITTDQYINLGGAEFANSSLIVGIYVAYNETYGAVWGLRNENYNTNDNATTGPSINNWYRVVINVSNVPSDHTSLWINGSIVYTTGTGNWNNQILSGVIIGPHGGAFGGYGVTDVSDTQLFFDDVLMGSSYADVETWTAGSAPTVSIANPTNTTYSSSSIMYSFTANGAVDTYWHNVLNESTWVYVLNQTGNSGTLTGFVNGSYTFYGYANDSSNNIGSNSVSFTVSVSTQNGSPYATSVSVSSTMVNQPSTLSAVWNGNGSNMAYFITQTNVTGTPVNSSATIFSGSISTYQFTVIGIVGNKVQWITYANNTADYWGNTDFQNFTIANVLSITVNSPTSTNYLVGNNVIVDISTSGSSTTTWYNLMNVTTWVYTNNQTYTSSANLTGISSLNCTYTLYAFANDTAGSLAISTVMFSVGVTYNATTGSMADIQTAVNAALAGGGGTVYIPVGDWNCNQTANGIFIDLETLPAGAWLNIIGSPTYNSTVVNNFGYTVTVPATILRSLSPNPPSGSIRTFTVVGSNTSYPSNFNYPNSANRHIRISGITILGTVTEDAGYNNNGIELGYVDGYLLDHLTIDSHVGAAIGTSCSKGVITNCYISDYYHLVLGGTWGYGIAVGGNGEFAPSNLGTPTWINNLTDIVGKYDWQGINISYSNPMFGNYTTVGWTTDISYNAGPVYIENCYFYYTRHAVSGGFSYGYYVVRYSTFDTTTNNAYLDAHKGTRGYEAYNNTFLAGGSYGPGFRGGGGVIYNNTFNGVYTCISLKNDPYDATDPTWANLQWINDIWIWDNTFTSYGTILSAPAGYGITAGLNYTHDSLGGTATPTSPAPPRPNYAAYLYPHPFDAGISYTLTGESESIVLTILAPQNTTYTSAIVNVEFATVVYNGTLGSIIWNCTYTNSTVAYANQTYTVQTNMTLGDGTYILQVWANTTDGLYTDYQTVTFTVGITYAGGTSQIIVNVWWGNYW